jgi:hypothetical protein
MSYLENIADEAKSILFEENIDYYNDKLDVKPINMSIDETNKLLFDKNTNLFDTLDKSNVVSGLSNINSYQRTVLKILESHPKGDILSKKIVYEKDYSIEKKFQNRIDQIDLLSDKLARGLEQLENEYRSQIEFIKNAMRPKPANLSEQQNVSGVLNELVLKAVDNITDVVPKKYMDKEGNEILNGINWEEEDKEIILNSLKNLVISHINNKPPYTNEIKQELKNILDMINNF